jgi:HEAT repeat protein
LIDTHGERVIPLLKDMAFDTKSPDDARRALFVLAHSQQPEARKIVVQAANSGAEPLRLAAIREIGRFDSASASTELMDIYITAATPTIRRQVVRSLGERSDDGALFRIVKLEPDMNVRNTAIVTLGRLRPAAGQLRLLYTQAPADSREAVLTALFNAKDDDGLIDIARSEKDPVFRARARRQLQLLATPKAIKFLEANP